uniref:Uncharacterized protein n=1 Tax=Ditylenchus dipsaci TaxID=166011 RepID=A0A915E538_9BILA
MTAPQVGTSPVEVVDSLEDVISDLESRLQEYQETHILKSSGYQKTLSSQPSCSTNWHLQHESQEKCPLQKTSGGQKRSLNSYPYCASYYSSPNCSFFYQLPTASTA